MTQPNRALQCKVHVIIQMCTAYLNIHYPRCAAPAFNAKALDMFSIAYRAPD